MKAVSPAPSLNTILEHLLDGAATALGFVALASASTRVVESQSQH